MTPAPPNPSVSVPPPDSPAAWRALTVVAAALLLGMSPWFAATSLGDQLAVRWSLDAVQVARLTSAVQWGFVVGTGLLAVSNLADLVPARRLFSVCALLAAAANAGLLWVDGYGPAVALRGLTGAFMAGIYPPAMKMMATWFRSGRGLAIGMVVAALTVGKALPYLLKAGGATSVSGVVLGTSAGCLAAAVLVLGLYRAGPLAFPVRPFSWGRVGELLRHRETALATGGYVGHMWELYAAWATIPAFLATVTPRPDLWGFLVIALGGVGAVWAGRWADLAGRIPVASGSLGISGLCALVIAWTAGLPTWVPVGIALVWGLTVVADSAQFSALVTEVAPAHAVGTALTLQTMVGFAVTGVSVELTPRIADAASWSWAYAVLVPGPLFGLACMRALARRRAVAG